MTGRKEGRKDENRVDKMDKVESRGVSEKKMCMTWMGQGVGE